MLISSKWKLPTENINKANQIPQDVSEEIFVLSDNELGFCDGNANEFICNVYSNNKVTLLEGWFHSLLKSNQKLKWQEKT